MESTLTFSSPRNSLTKLLQQQQHDASLSQTAQGQDRKCVPSLTPSRSFLQIRIVGGRSTYEGRVEVQVGSKWGTVCSSGWTTREAMVVCRQLGLGYSMHAINVSLSKDSNHLSCHNEQNNNNMNNSKLIKDVSD